MAAVLVGKWRNRCGLSQWPQLMAKPDGWCATRLRTGLAPSVRGWRDSVTRERRTLRARYKLVEAAQGTVVLDATAGSDSGIDVVSSEYATVAAEDTALENLTKTVADQIVARIALYVQRTAPQ
jgi:hypothetical protein